MIPLKGRRESFVGYGSPAAGARQRLQREPLQDDERGRDRERDAEEQPLEAKRLDEREDAEHRQRWH